MMKNSLLILLLSLNASASPFGFKKYTFFAFSEGSYFSTKSNFDNNGKVAVLAGNNRFEELKLSNFASFDISDYLGIYTSLDFKRAQSLSTTFERTNTGLSDFSLGTDYHLVSGFINIVPDLSVTFPLHGVETSSTLLDDNAAKATAKAYISSNFGFLSAAVFGGYTYKTQGLSSSIPWGLITNINIEPFFADLRISGETSLKNDEFKNTPATRTTPLDTFNGGSYIYRSFDPSSVNGLIRLGWKFSKNLAITAGVDQTLLGENSAVGVRYLVGLGFITPAPIAPTARKDKDKEFVPLNEEESDPRDFVEDMGDAPTLDKGKKAPPTKPGIKVFSPIR